MPEVSESATWQVVTAKLYDRGDPANGAEETSIAEGPEDETRRVYADTVAQAADRGYQYVTLRHNGEDVESWPQRTGWTV
ncbi:hypothetical protein [Mycolicibacterium baixiangningiae]|uniref:hypothetical protein n=1 Tax=Mycolicibacterium baixiangningiae TaxID=2761578 RepID=UPI0018687F7B|nr:hypothetical protein [Mycolicibacterium baixiangningiae]